MKFKPVIFLILLFIIVFTIFYYSKFPLTPYVIINNHKIYTELAVTPKEKEKGLGYRQNLQNNKGMLFVFDHKEKFGFWMGGMNFPLDFVWIDDKKIVDITENVPVKSLGKYTTLQPKVEVNRVLELNAGSVDKLEIKIGDLVTYNN